MTTLTWTPYGSGIALLSTGLDALADGGHAMSAEIDNGTARNLYLDLVLDLASGVTAGSGAPGVVVYLLPSPGDSAVYPTPPGTSAGAAPASYSVGRIAAIASASFQRGVLRGVVVPPGKYRVQVLNELGVAMPASGNTLTGYPYSEEAT